MPPYTPFLGLKLLVWSFQPTFKDEKSAIKLPDIYPEPSAFHKGNATGFYCHFCQ